MGNKLLFYLTVIICCFLFANANEEAKGRPNIIFILADDLGWNDVGFHGSDEIPTPNIDALAYRGVILNNYYVQPLCTPSRSALMTGKYPIHLGMQHYVLLNTEPRGLPLSEKLLPQYLKDLNYSTHAVGKWHLGFFKKEYTPKFRGFDSHIGHWTGQQDYYDHTGIYKGIWGMDMHRGLKSAWDLHGRYTTELYTEEAVKVINAHKRKTDKLKRRKSDGNGDNPLFLYLSHNAVHSGNEYSPLQAPSDIVERFSYIEDYKRRKYAAMVHMLDDSVGKVVEALADNEMLNNSIIIFATDNGGAPAGLDNNVASNWPLRGAKFSLWEGGTRGAALIWSPLIKKRGRVAKQLMHISDWLPTLISVVNGSSVELPGIDGHDAWKALSEDLPSKRKEVLLNIDSIEDEAGLILSDWKIMMGTATRFNGTWDDWYGPSGLDEKYKYDVELILNSQVSNAMDSIGYYLEEWKMLSLREKARVTCNVNNAPNDAYDHNGRSIAGPPIPCDIRTQICLFNTREDPCERRNLVHLYPHVAAHLYNVLTNINATALPPGNIPTVPYAHPSLWHHAWVNYGDKCMNKKGGMAKKLCPLQGEMNISIN